MPVSVSEFIEQAYLRNADGIIQAQPTVAFDTHNRATYTANEIES